MNRFVAMLLLLIFTCPIGAQEPIRFARSPAVSPDGTLVAFSYLGDLWLVDANGGSARHLTMHEKHDYNPIFSPDGKWIAFSSNRHGQYDVFVVSVQGGRPKRLTHDSADDHPTGWSPDSQRILFMSGRHVDFPSRVEFYSVALNGGEPRRISVYEGRDAAYSPTGDRIAYVRGPGLWYRKGYLGSSNDDIWICAADGSNNRQITHHKGQDNYPMWSHDGKQLYYVSDCSGGLANLVTQPIDDAEAKPVALTKHKSESVRRARMSANGQVIAYECCPDLWLYSVKDGTSRKLNIEIRADDKANAEVLKTFTAGATEFAWSPNEQHVAFVVHGEIFLMPRKGGKAKRLTDHPAYDHGLAWAPDGKRLLFLSDRSGREDIFALESDDPDHADLASAHQFKVTQLTSTPAGEVGVNFAPDGQRVTFLRGGRLISMDPDGKNEKTISNVGQIFDYEWSPDGRWICYARMDASFASELFIIPASGPTTLNPARNVTRFATYNGGVSWSRTGNRLAFISNRAGNVYSAYVMSLKKPTTFGNIAIDWDNVHQRVRQPAPLTVNECAISGDGAKIAFRASVDGSEDLWIANCDGGSVVRLTTGNLKPAQITWSRLVPGQISFRDAGGSLRIVTVGAAVTVGPTTIGFTAKTVIRQDEVFLEMFDQSWRALNDSFYDPRFHGADWKQIRAKYRPLVPHCAMKEDFFALISLMLGELNASHLGIRGDLGAPEQQTADLGLLFDERYPGPGLKIAEIVKNGPADQRGIKVKPGEFIVKIDGTTLTEYTEVAKLLNDKVGEAIVLHIAADPANPKLARRVEVRGENRQKIAPLMYERWIAKNAERVKELSKGRLGYIHIPNMQESGLERFVRSLYSDNFDKDGIVLDVRYNGGGFTHDQVLNYLTGKEHTHFTHRDGTFGLVLRSSDRKWTKPLVLLINNRSFSDAEIFPHAFRTWGLGKLVGQPTGGFVIGTREMTLIDGSKFRTPRIGVHTVKGVNMEKEGVMPDITIVPHPEQMARGVDVQLDKAVEVLAANVNEWRKTRPAAAGGAGVGKPGTAPP